MNTMSFQSMKTFWHLMRLWMVDCGPTLDDIKKILPRRTGWSYRERKATLDRLQDPPDERNIIECEYITQLKNEQGRLWKFVRSCDLRLVESLEMIQIIARLDFRSSPGCRNGNHLLLLDLSPELKRVVGMVNFPLAMRYAEWIQYESPLSCNNLRPKTPEEENEDWFEGNENLPYAEALKKFNTFILEDPDILNNVRVFPLTKYSLTACLQALRIRYILGLLEPVDPDLAPPQRREVLYKRKRKMQKELKFMPESLIPLWKEYGCLDKFSDFPYPTIHNNGNTGVNCWRLFRAMLYMSTMRHPTVADSCRREGVCFLMDAISDHYGSIFNGDKGCLLRKTLYGKYDDDYSCLRGYTTDVQLIQGRITSLVAEKQFVSVDSIVWYYNFDYGISSNFTEITLKQVRKAVARMPRILSNSNGLLQYDPMSLQEAFTMLQPYVNDYILEGEDKMRNACETENNIALIPSFYNLKHFFDMVLQADPTTADIGSKVGLLSRDTVPYQFWTMPADDIRRFDPVWHFRLRLFFSRLMLSKAEEKAAAYEKCKFDCVCWEECEETGVDFPRPRRRPSDDEDSSSSDSDEDIEQIVTDLMPKGFGNLLDPYSCVTEKTPDYYNEDVDTKIDKKLDKDKKNEAKETEKERSKQKKSLAKKPQTTLSKTEADLKQFRVLSRQVHQAYDNLHESFDENFILKALNFYYKSTAVFDPVKFRTHSLMQLVDSALSGNRNSEGFEYTTTPFCEAKFHLKLASLVQLLDRRIFGWKLDDAHSLYEAIYGEIMPVVNPSDASLRQMSNLTEAETVVKLAACSGPTWIAVRRWMVPEYRMMNLVYVLNSCHLSDPVDKYDLRKGYCLLQLYLNPALATLIRCPGQTGFGGETDMFSMLQMPTADAAAQSPTMTASAKKRLKQKSKSKLAEDQKAKADAERHIEESDLLCEGPLIEPGTELAFDFEGKLSHSDSDSWNLYRIQVRLMIGILPMIKKPFSVKNFEECQSILLADGIESLMKISTEVDTSIPSKPTPTVSAKPVDVPTPQKSDFEPIVARPAQKDVVPVAEVEDKRDSQVGTFRQHQQAQSTASSTPLRNLLELKNPQPECLKSEPVTQPVTKRPGIFLPTAESLLDPDMDENPSDDSPSPLMDRIGAAMAAAEALRRQLTQSKPLVKPQPQQTAAVPFSGATQLQEEPTNFSPGLVTVSPPKLKLGFPTISPTARLPNINFSDNDFFKPGPFQGFKQPVSNPAFKHPVFNKRESDNLDWGRVPSSQSIHSSFQGQVAESVRKPPGLFGAQPLAQNTSSPSRLQWNDYRDPERMVRNLPTPEPVATPKLLAIVKESFSFPLLVRKLQEVHTDTSVLEGLAKGKSDFLSVNQGAIVNVLEISPCHQWAKCVVVGDGSGTPTNLNAQWSCSSFGCKGFLPFNVLRLESGSQGSV